VEPGVEGLPPDTSLPDIGIRKTTPAPEVFKQPETLQLTVVASYLESRLPEHGARTSRSAYPCAGAASSGAAPLSATDSQPHPWAADMQPVSNLPSQQRPSATQTFDVSAAVGCHQPSSDHVEKGSTRHDANGCQEERRARPGTVTAATKGNTGRRYGDTRPGSFYPA